MAEKVRFSEKFLYIGVYKKEKKLEESGRKRKKRLESGRKRKKVEEMFRKRKKLVRNISNCGFDMCNFYIIYRPKGHRQICLGASGHFADGPPAALLTRLLPEKDIIWASSFLSLSRFVNRMIENYQFKATSTDSMILRIIWKNISSMELN